MGPIQSSLNQLTLSTLGAIRSGLKGFKKPEDNDLPDTNIYTFQQPAARNSYTMAAEAQRRGNDYIAQKARAVYFSPTERLARIKAATSMEASTPQEREAARYNMAMTRFTTRKKGGKK